MNLRENEAKEIFKAEGIAVPRGGIARNIDEANELFNKLGQDVVLKPIGIKKRGKTGLVSFANKEEQVREFANKVLGKTFNGTVINEIIIEEKIGMFKEIYVAIAIDFEVGKPVLIISPSGGMEIEEIAIQNRNSVKKLHIGLIEGIDEKEVKRTIMEAGLGELEEGIIKITKTLWKIFSEMDAELIEINPLALAKNGELVALDAVLTVNDDSLFKHEKFNNIKKQEAVTVYEKEMNEAGWHYVDLEGNVGIVCSGAGLCMATIDLLNENRCKPADFLDVAQIDGEGIYKAFNILKKKPGISVMFVNLFAGLNRCDSMAEGIVKFANENKGSIPVVVRMVGNQEEKGAEILKNAGIRNIRSLEEAVAEVSKVITNGNTVR